VEPGKQLTLAEHYLEVGQPERALSALEQATSDEAVAVWNLRAQAYLDLERYDEAAEAAARGLSDEPYDVELLGSLAIAEWNRNELAAAERALLAALEILPDHPRLLSIYAHVVASAGQFDKARRLVERASELDPDDAFVARTRMELAYLSGRDKEAELHGVEALALDPEDAQTHSILGVTAAERGQTLRGARHLRGAAELDPSIAHYAEGAREARKWSHPLVWPLWPIARFGPGPVWVAGIVLLIASARVAPPTVAGVILIVWIVFVAYSWLAPPLLERWLDRRLP
jgi:tetratricopeptide (TPR) repeat protein